MDARALLSGLGVLRAGLRVLGRHRVATAVGFVLAVAYFVGTIRPAGAVTDRGVTLGADRDSVALVGSVAQWYVHTTAAVWLFGAVVALVALGPLGALVVRNSRDRHLHDGDAVRDELGLLNPDGLVGWDHVDGVPAGRSSRDDLGA